MEDQDMDHILLTVLDLDELYPDPEQMIPLTVHFKSEPQDIPYPVPGQGEIEMNHSGEGSYSSSLGSDHSGEGSYTNFPGSDHSSEPASPDQTQRLTNDGSLATMFAPLHDVKNVLEIIESGPTQRQHFIKQEHYNENEEGSSEESDEYDDAMDTASTTCKIPKRSRQGPHLWRFLYDQLSTGQYTEYLHWIDRNQGIFEVTDRHKVAQLWGQEKRKPDMTWDHVARALRYYYKPRIMFKLREKKLMYQFGRKAYDLLDKIFHRGVNDDKILTII